MIFHFAVSGGVLIGFDTWRFFILAVPDDLNFMNYRANGIVQNKPMGALNIERFFSTGNNSLGPRISNVSSSKYSFKR